MSNSTFIAVAVICSQIWLASFPVNNKTIAQMRGLFAGVVWLAFAVYASMKQNGYVQ